MKDINEKLKSKRKYLIAFIVIALLLILVFIPLISSGNRASDKQIYDYSSALYKTYEQEAFKLNDANPDENVQIKSDRLVQAEEKAISDTAKKFNISQEEVVKIVADLQ